MSREPNASVSGAVDSEVCVPVPVRSTVTSAALESTVTVADFAPVEVGSKRPRTLHVSPAARTVVVGAVGALAREALELAGVGAADASRRRGPPARSRSS